MHHINLQQKGHLAEITKLLSMYQVLTLPQLSKLFPELDQAKLFSLIKRLEKSGRLVFDAELGRILYSKECVPDPAIHSAFWVLLDFMADITYHTISDFPVTLSFYTHSDAYDVIYAAPEKEILLNHALVRPESGVSHRLVIVENIEQIPLLTFPDISAFCQVMPDGSIHYYKKQGDSQFDG